MSLNTQAMEALITLSHKTAGTGIVVTAGSVAIEKSERINFLSATGPEIVNLCALIGVVLTAVGVLAGIWFQWDRRRREIMLSERPSNFYRQGSADE